MSLTQDAVDTPMQIKLMIELMRTQLLKCFIVILLFQIMWSIHKSSYAGILEFIYPQ